MDEELAGAAEYVASIMPGDLAGPVQVSSLFIPWSTVGGDIFDYRWIGDDHLIVYLADVSGHGLEAALVAVSVHNLIRSGSLPMQTLKAPDHVLGELNRRFQMDDNNGHFLTIWFGVYQQSNRTLTYAAAGHLPALVFFVDDEHPIRLDCRCPPVGVHNDIAFCGGSIRLPPDVDIFLYSDGAFELPLRDGGWFELEDFVDLLGEFVTEQDTGQTSSLDTLAEHLRDLSTTGNFADDCSLIRLHVS